MKNLTMQEIDGLRLDDSGKLAIPSHIKRLKFDIGTSYCAPNAAAWLRQDESNEVFVVAVEPNRYSVESLTETKRLYDPEDSAVEFTYSDSNFMLINCAIDQVEGVQEAEFYHTTLNAGCSSLLKPTSILNEQGVGVKELSKVKVTSFKSILDLVPWDRFDYIEHVKTDCQGADLRVFLSADDYVKKFVYLDAEVYTHAQYEGEVSPQRIINRITQAGFKLIISSGNCTFINTSLSSRVLSDNIQYCSPEEIVNGIRSKHPELFNGKNLTKAVKTIQSH